VISHPVLEQAARAGVRLGLERVRTFLGVLGEPQLAAPSVHVAGTNGKGSVATYVTGALVAAGYRVGTTLSPHVEQLNERVQIDGVPLADGELSEVIEHVARARGAWAEAAGLAGDPLTYFELITVVAFVAFARNQVDVQVVEVGLGGRLDATRVVQPVACAITQVGLDHTAILGDTVGEIAGEKAGIIERGVPVVAGPLPAAARTVVQRIAASRGAPLWAPPKLRHEIHRDGTVTLATPQGSIGPLRLGLQGPHQAANAAVALGVLHRLRGQGFRMPDEAIARGLRDAFLPARLEEVAPGLVLDGAHNPDGAAVLAGWLEKRPRPASRVLLLGMGADRDPGPMIAALAPHFDEIVTTRCAHPKAWDPLKLAVAIQGAHPAVSAGGDIEAALPEVYAEAHETVVAGSLFVAGAARALWRAGHLAGIATGQGLATDLPELT